MCAAPWNQCSVPSQCPFFYISGAYQMDLSHDTLSLCSTTSVKGVEHIKGTEIFPEIPVDEIKKE